MVEDIGGDFHIHIPIYYKGTKPRLDLPPFTFNNTIEVILDETIPMSPTINRDGHFVIWEDDLMSPLFVNMLLEEINSISCCEKPSNCRKPKTTSS